METRTEREAAQLATWLTLAVDNERPLLRLFADASSAQPENLLASRLAESKTSLDLQALRDELDDGPATRALLGAIHESVVSGAPLRRLSCVAA